MFGGGGEFKMARVLQYFKHHSVHNSPYHHFLSPLLLPLHNADLLKTVPGT